MHLGRISKYDTEYFVDVQDNACLHVAAMTNPEVNNERLFAFTEPFNWK